MATVTMDLTQSGSGSTELHLEVGDTLTLELNETVFSNLLDQGADQLGSIITQETGITIAFNNAGGASQKLALIQTGSASATINAESGDTVTGVLNETVFSNALDQAMNQLESILSAATGVTFAFSNSGNAS